MVDEKQLIAKYEFSKEACKRSCQAIDMCNAFTYDPDTRDCVIMALHSNDNINESPGKIFGLKYCSGVMDNFILNEWFS